MGPYLSVPRFEHRCIARGSEIEISKMVQFFTETETFSTYDDDAVPGQSRPGNSSLWTQFLRFPMCRRRAQRCHWPTKILRCLEKDGTNRSSQSVNTTERDEAQRSMYESGPKSQQCADILVDRYVLHGGVAVSSMSVTTSRLGRSR